MDDLSTRLIEQIPRLRRYARALTGDAAAADDLVQDCLERAWSRLSLWRRGSNLRAWLFTIMHNLHVNDVHQARARPVVVPLGERGADGRVRPGQEAAVEAHGILAALALLPLEQRQVVLLVAVEQFTYQEAAAMLRVPVGTIMSRLSRGRERLRELAADGAGRTMGTGR